MGLDPSDSVCEGTEKESGRICSSYERRGDTPIPATRVINHVQNRPHRGGTFQLNMTISFRKKIRPNEESNLTIRK